MGIYDRDYMRQREEPSSLFARWHFWLVAGLLVLVSCAILLPIIANRGTMNDAESPFASQAEREAPNVVNVNKAALDQLDALPYISPATAQAIIDGRPYSRPEDLLRVRGIKQKTLEKIRNHIRFD